MPQDMIYQILLNTHNLLSSINKNFVADPKKKKKDIELIQLHTL